MNDMNDPRSSTPPAPEEPPPMVLPVRFPPNPPPPPPPPPRRPAPSTGAGGFFRVLLLLALAASVGINLVLILGFGLAGLGGLGDSSSTLIEKTHSGKTSARDKIAIIRVDGVLMEGMIGYPLKQIEAAAQDKNVKAIVLRISSPGGSITSSDELFVQLKKLRQGEITNQKGGGKPIVVSMGNLAASGGYYIAMAGGSTRSGETPPAEPETYIFAERTTITGSIGVYAAFPNIAKLADDYGIKMDVIKAGAVKDSGSMFHRMSAQERRLWQDMVDHAYDQFLSVVVDGRPELTKAKLRDEIVKREEIPDLDEKGNVKKEGGQVRMVEYVRRRADGGIYTAADAEKFGLIDKIGFQDDAIKRAKEMANLTEYRVVQYEKTPSLMNALMGSQGSASTVGQPLEPGRLASGLSPRLWYLAPQSELAGVLAAMGRE